ncbi:MAG: M20 family metallopeptidase [Clostridiaceae bacterium]|nr:M20 family metallopeptidase [Clostridiaceae bacterium]
MNAIEALKAVDKEYIIALRRELHRFPELAFDLPMTLALVRRELNSLGIPYTEKYGDSSITAFINPDCKKFTIGIRADMDALPLTEKTGLPFASEHPGIMHACGHDAHTAMLLGTAKALKSVEDALACRVVLVFQACEEGELSGARRMVEDGLMNEIDVIIGMHVENGFDRGTVGICPGASMAASHPLHIEFFGKTAHATLPQTGVNALAMAVNTYGGISNLLATRMNPLDKYVCCVGMLSAGSTDNVIPDYAEMKVSLRSYDVKIESFIVDNIRKIAENAAAEQGGSMSFHEDVKALPLINDPIVTEHTLAAARKVVGPENIVAIPAKLSSEDFSFYLAHKPGAFFRLGTRNEAKGCVTLPHNNNFLLDEDALEIGSKVSVQFVLDNMAGIPDLRM